MSNKTITIAITESTYNDLKSLIPHMRNEPSIEQAAVKAIEQGIGQLTYRYARNAKVWIQSKEEKNELVALRALAAQMAKDSQESK